MPTIDKLTLVLTILTALGSGLIAGVFFAFSIAVMRALGRLPSAAGIASMQSINLVIVNPLFLGVFLGTAAFCVVLTVSSLFRWERPGTLYLLAGAILYVAGSFLVTIVWNVPMNNALASVEPDSANGARVWTDYLANWTFWNHIRTTASLAAAALLTMSAVESVK